MNRLLCWLRRTVTPTNPHQAQIDALGSRIERQNLEMDRAIGELIKATQDLKR